MSKSTADNQLPPVGAPGASDLLPFLTGMILFPKRVKKVLEDYGRDRQREETISVIRQRYEEAVRAGASNFAQLHNVSLYMLLFDEDLSAYTQDFFLANTNRRHRFVARHLASLVYEGTQDVPSLIGGNYRKALSAVEFPGDWRKDLSLIASAFNTFKQDHANELHAIRNIVGAHKDDDAAKQLEILDKINPMSIYQLAAKFSEPLGELLQFQINVTLHLGKLRVMLKEISIGVSGG